MYVRGSADVVKKTKSMRQGLTSLHGWFLMMVWGASQTAGEDILIGGVVAYGGCFGVLLHSGENDNGSRPCAWSSALLEERVTTSIVNVTQVVSAIWRTSFGYKLLQRGQTTQGKLSPLSFQSASRGFTPAAVVASAEGYNARAVAVPSLCPSIVSGNHICRLTVDASASSCFLILALLSSSAKIERS